MVTTRRGAHGRAPPVCLERGAGGKLRDSAFSRGGRRPPLVHCARQQSTSPATCHGKQQSLVIRNQPLEADPAWQWARLAAE